MTQFGSQRVLCDDGGAVRVVLGQIVVGRVARRDAHHFGTRGPDGVRLLDESDVDVAVHQHALRPLHRLFLVLQIDLTAQAVNVINYFI